MGLLDKFLLPAAVEPEQPKPLLDIFSQTDGPRRWVAPGKEVQDSRDLQRILELPRREPLVRSRGDTRELDPALEAITAALEAKLGKGDAACSCAPRICARHLLPVQAWALHEGPLAGGILGPIGVGDGKTLLDLLMPMVMPDCRVAVLLVPASLVKQLVTVDWEFYGQHWHLPNRAGGRWFWPNRPVVHVMSYDKLSREEGTVLLESLKPDLIIGDEIHMVLGRSVRAQRFKKFCAAKKPRVCGWSGTLTKRSLRDYAPVSALALGDGAPTPLHWPTVDEWADALDPLDFPAPPGALRRLCDPGETAHDGFRRRLVTTRGVIASPDVGNCQASLVFHQRDVTVPPAVEAAISEVERSWQRPDGEELVDVLSVARCARELASGFFYRWRWPRMEPPEVIERWLAARKAWHRELREKLKSPKPHLDSPLLCAKAAIRFMAGYDGPLPVWDSGTWPEWVEVRDTAKPETQAVWVDEFLARDAADWLGKHTGICWYEHDAFGRRVAELSRCPLYGPGEDASVQILREDASRSIVASARAHGTGKNLQSFSTQLVATPPSDGAAWEQLIGRTHRQGQKADEVSVYVYRHTDAVRNALDRARMLAGHIQGTFGGSQKLLRATYLGLT